MIRQGKSELCVGLSELQAFARVETGEEEALLAGLLRVATEMGESFCNLAFMARPFEEDARGAENWTLVGIQPVRSISVVTVQDAAAPMASDEYRVSIDHDGRGFVQGLPCGKMCRIQGQAGLATEPNEVPEPIRQGILRLAALMYANRDSATGDIPSAVTTLWRPYRRAGLQR